MRKLWICGICAALLCCTGCGETSSQTDSEPAEKNSAGDMTVEAADGFDETYQTLIADYFQAIENEDLEAYKAAMYPPYLEAFEKYVTENGSSLEERFQEVCHRFDEDGYESWKLTKLELSYYPEDKVDLDDFFDAYASAGIFDADFIANCKEDTSEIKDVQFSLYALYEGDEEPVQVIGGSEMMVMKNADGAYLFG